ncbi:MAG: metallophosphoesterase family protein [Balneolaceae bacterium]
MTDPASKTTIALISDIHANAEALQVVLEDLDRRAPDAVYCLGDLIGYGPSPNEVIKEIRKRKMPVIAGNHDEKIARWEGEPPSSFRAEPTASTGEEAARYTHFLVTAEHRHYLSGLPSHLRLEYGHPEDPWTILLAHGSTRRINEYLLEEHDERDLLSMMIEARADVLAVGHTHKPYHRILTDEHGRHRHVINTGSVGKPKDGDPRAGYVLLEWAPPLNRQQPDSLSVQFIRLPYDIESTARAIEKSPLPDPLAEMLRTGQG